MQYGTLPSPRSNRTVNRSFEKRLSIESKLPERHSRGCDQSPSVGVRLEYEEVAVGTSFMLKNRVFLSYFND